MIRITKVRKEVGVTINMGDYSNLKLSTVVEAEIDEHESPEDAQALVFSAAKEAIVAEINDLLQDAPRYRRAAALALLGVKLEPAPAAPSLTSPGYPEDEEDFEDWDDEDEEEPEDEGDYEDWDDEDTFSLVDGDEESTTSDEGDGEPRASFGELNY